VGGGGGGEKCLMGMRRTKQDAVIRGLFKTEASSLWGGDDNQGETVRGAMYCDRASRKAE